MKNWFHKSFVFLFMLVILFWIEIWKIIWVCKIKLPLILVFELKYVQEAASMMKFQKCVCISAVIMLTINTLIIMDENNDLACGKDWWIFCWKKEFHAWFFLRGFYSNYFNGLFRLQSNHVICNLISVMVMHTS